MSPEYAIDGQFSVKSDVYSFGVLLVEIASGMKNRLFIHHDHSLNLLGHVSINILSVYDVPHAICFLPLISCIIKF